MSRSATDRELLDRAIHFSFPDGSDCYEFELECKGTDQNGKVWPPGTTLWEARGCPKGEPVQWFETQRDALAAIGHPRSK